MNPLLLISLASASCTGTECSNVDVHTMPATASCLTGYALDVDRTMCVKAFSTPAQHICRGGRTTADGFCSAEIRVKPNYCCPEETHRQVNGKCLATYEEEATAECPGGYTRVGEHCIMYNKKKTKCPIGSVRREGGRCVRTEKIAADRVCKAGSRKINQECVEVELTEERDISCPDFMMLAGDMCLKDHIVSDAEIVCAEDYYVLGDMCAKKEFECTMCQGVCCDDAPAQIELTSPNKICPAGYALEGDECVVRTSYALSCEVGFLNEDLLCELDVELTPECKDGWALIGGQCVSNVITDPSSITCPEDTMRAGTKCVTTISAPAEYSCPVNWADNGKGGCEKVTTTAAYDSCPEGYFLGSHNKCIMEEEVELAETCVGKMRDGLCVSSDVRVGKRCSRGTLGANGYCSYEEVVGSVDITCPAEYSLRGKFCVKQSLTKASIKCPGGAVYDKRSGKCVRVKESKAKLACANGFILEEGLCRRF